LRKLQHVHARFWEDGAIECAVHARGLLRRYLYGRPLELKRDARLRDAVFFILDCLAENG
jgi:hypothetical protein